MNDSSYLTDLTRDLTAIRDEALRRLLVFEGPRLKRVLKGLSTDDLVARVESHADFCLDTDAMGGTVFQGLGRWAAPPASPPRPVVALVTRSTAPEPERD